MVNDATPPTPQVSPGNPIPKAASTRRGQGMVSTADHPAGSTANAGSGGVVLPPSCDHYELLGEIARGGMGVVFKAQHRSLKRIVALKMIRQGTFATPGELRRFESEARAAAALDHPNIVPIYEFGQIDGQPFFTMPLVEGEDLGALVRQRGALPAPAAVALMLPVVEAVQYAHQTGFIHRDLKPGNILIDVQGRPRVTDFGLAKQVGTDSSTVSGEILGTPRFMSPEQARGDSNLVGPEADVYALGGILFFMLSGQAPFRGKDMADLLYKVAWEPAPSPRSLVPNLPEALDELVLACLEKDPAQRLTLSALLASLRRLGKPSLPESPTLSSQKPASPLCAASAGRHSAPTMPPSCGRGPSAAPRRRLLLTGSAGLLILTLLAGCVAWGLPLSCAGPSSPPPPAVQPTAAVDLPGLGTSDFPLETLILGASKRADGSFHVLQGAKVRLAITPGDSTYIGVWTINPQGDKIIQLFPNDLDKDNLVKQDQTRMIPGNKDYELDSLELSTGMEKLIVVASTRPWDPMLGEKEGPFAVFQSQPNRERLAAQFRGFKVRSYRADVRVAHATLPYEILAR